MCWHKWTKWEIREEEGTITNRKTGASRPAMGRWQERTCKKCGKYQKEDIRF